MQGVGVEMAGELCLASRIDFGFSSLSSNAEESDKKGLEEILSSLELAG